MMLFRLYALVVVRRKLLYLPLTIIAISGVMGYTG